MPKPSLLHKQPEKTMTDNAGNLHLVMGEGAESVTLQEKATGKIREWHFSVIPKYFKKDN